jgi:hypothetical protein
LRRHISTNGGIPPTAFASYTAHLDALAEPLPQVNRRHLLARLNNLEWVFSKTDLDVLEQVQALAEAVQSLPRLRAGFPFKVDSWLGIDLDSPLAERYSAEVEASAPPIFELTEWSHGIAVVRWLLHRVLPYPGFLWNSRRLASRLRVQHDSLIRALNRKTKLRAVLERYRYKGALANFLGPRWWRAGIEYILWQETDGKSLNSQAISKALKRVGGVSLAPLDLKEPVLCVDRNFELVAQPTDSTGAVRIRPDDWPASAEQPWMALTSVRKNDELKSLVVPEDRERV